MQGTASVPGRENSSSEADPASPAPDAMGSPDRSAGMGNPSPPKPGTYIYEVTYDKTGPRREERAVTAVETSGIRVESPLSGHTELLAWSADGIKVIATYQGENQDQACVWDPPILFVPFRPAAITSEAKCAVGDGDHRTQFSRTDQITATESREGVVIEYVTTSESRLVVSNPNWRGGSPGNTLRLEGTQEWDLGVGLPRRGEVEVSDTFSGGKRTVDFELLPG